MSPSAAPGDPISESLLKILRYSSTIPDRFNLAKSEVDYLHAENNPFPENAL
jgi:hypothetical protein